MTEFKDTANIGLSEKSHMKLKEMTDSHMFSDMKDGYRLAVAIALQKNVDAREHILVSRKNMYDVGGVDDNFIFRNTIRLLIPDQTGKEYRYVEKLADLGIAFIYDNFEESGELNLETLL